MHPIPLLPWCPQLAMVVVKEVVNSRGLNFTNQRKVFLLRTQKRPLGFQKIAQRERNLQKEPSTEDVCRRVFERFNIKKGRVQYHFAKCGRKPWKMTAAVGSYLIKKLRQERRRTICIFTSLQAFL